MSDPTPTPTPAPNAEPETTDTDTDTDTGGASGPDDAELRATSAILSLLLDVPAAARTRVLDSVYGVVVPGRRRRRSAGAASA